MKKIELLAPAGDLEKMKYAIEYGADACYLGIPDFSLRARINKFDEKSLQEGAEYAHKNKKKVYITLNIYAHNQHIAKIEKHLKFLKKINPDGIIVSDPGIIDLIKKYLPKTDIHLSTQANTTNWQAVKFWKSIGVKRVILAREVTLREVREIRERVPGIELEYFVHGAMCMSYSGRCILSKWMTGRSANLGDCAQPCRWAYKKVGEVGGIREMSVVDGKKRFGMDVEEDQHGTYLFNSFDMNLIEYVDKLIAAGITSLKIEGRAKSVYYVSVVTRAYRKAVDATGKNNYKKIIVEQKKELDRLTNRGYSTGFLLGNEPPHDFSDRNRSANFSFVGEILGEKDGINIVRVHNALHEKDKLEAITPDGNIPIKIISIFDEYNKKIDEAHGGHKSKYYFKFNKPLSEKTLIRKAE